MKYIFLLVSVLIVTSCAPLDTAVTILDIFYPTPPTPICDKDSAGTAYNGKICLKFSDNDYRWVVAK